LATNPKSLSVSNYCHLVNAAVKTDHDHNNRLLLLSSCLYFNLFTYANKNIK